MILRLILKIAITAGTLILVAQYVPGITVTGWYPALIAALILGVVNITLKPILLLFTLPLNLATLGLFTFILNAALFWFVGSFVDGFEVAGFLPAFLGALIISIVSSVAHKFL